jgi:hypothetical protein
MFVTSDVFHRGMSTVPAAPQSAGSVVREQQLAPEDTAARQLSTASFRAAELRKGAAVLRGSQKVSMLDASSPASLVEPAGQSTHVLACTLWFAVHVTCTHVPGGPSYAPLEVSNVTPMHTVVLELL